MTQYDVAVIGSGPGGYVAAIRAAQLGLKTCCIEKGPLGGTCLNVGCIPSKSLLHSSELYYKAQNEASSHGLTFEKLGFDFDKMCLNKEKTITTFRGGIAALFKKNKIDSFTANASFINPHELQVGDLTIKAKYIILATGSLPTALPFAPFDEKRILSSTGALALTEIPKKLLVVGAGVIGCELGSVFKRLGSQVEFLEFLPTICPAFDASLCKALQKALEKQGMRFHLGAKVSKIEATDTVRITATHNDQEITFEGSHVLIAVGRKSNTEGLNLEKANLSTVKGQIPVDSAFRTAQSHIFAIGDLIDGPMLAHKASDEGVAVAEIIAGKNPLVDYISIPNVIYTYPEVASVGLTQEEAEKTRVVKTGQFSFASNSRAKATGETEGFVKVVIDEKSEKILGVHIIGSHAGELIAECALALHHRMSAQDLAKACHAHPTLSEAIKEASLAAYDKAIHQ